MTGRYGIRYVMIERKSSASDRRLWACPIAYFLSHY